METGLRGYLLTGDSRFLEPYQEAQSVFDTSYKRLQQVSADDTAQTNSLNNAWGDIMKWRQFAYNALTAKIDNNSAGDIAAQLEGKRLMDSIRGQLTTFVEVENQVRDQRIRTTQSTTQWVILIVVVGGVAIGALVGLLTVRQLIGLSRNYEQIFALSHKQAGELLTQQEWLSGVLSSIGDAVIATDMLKNVTFINPVTERLTGWSAQEAAGKPITDVYNVIIDNASQQSDTATGSKELIARDSKTIPIEDKINLIKDSHGNQLGTVVVFRDVSRRKTVEQERLGLIEAQSHYASLLRQSNEQLQQFAYIASHDLQEPLRMVTSYLQLLESRYADSLDSDAREFIGFAVDGAARMRDLITGLLQYARLDTAEQDIYQQTSMQTTLDEALTNLAIPIEEASAVITHDDLPSVQADSMQMMQILQNLIGNALKFRGEQPLKIHIGVEKKAKEWQFSVRDNGIGIAPDSQERIFGMFQRLHVNSAYSGTGIGLTICKKVVERHNGRIWVESTVGQGSTFYFTLPMNPAQPSTAASKVNGSTSA
jgi:PAS domain S-box-containing protein